MLERLEFPTLTALPRKSAEAYKNQEFSRMALIYTDFVSMMSQEGRGCYFSLLPLSDFKRGESRRKSEEDS